MDNNKNSWIPITTKLPAREEPVLVWCGYIEIAMLNESGSWVCVLNNSSVYCITHWQELPEQP